MINNTPVSLAPLGFLRRFLPLLLAGISVACPPFLSAFDVRTLKLHGRPTGTADNAAFGLGLALSDRYVLVGAPYNSDEDTQAGAAYLFNARNGRFLRRLRAPGLDADDNFGVRTAIQGNIGAVAATRDDGDRGSVFLFDLRNGRLLRKLTATDGAPDDTLGSAMAFCGDLLVVGAQGDNANRGSVYLFDVHTGNQLDKLQAPGGVGGDRFGYSLASSGDFLVVGAPGYDGSRGRAYFFDVRTFYLHYVGTGENPGDGYGTSVAIWGDSALVGAPNYNGFEGRAYHVVLPGFFLAFLQIPIDASTSIPGDQFGISVAMNENLALIGSWMDSDPLTHGGSVFVFNVRTLAEMGRMTAPDANLGSLYGTSVAISENQAAVGAWGDDDRETRSGAVYLHRELAGGLGMNVITGSRHSAPGTVDADFGGFREAYLNPSGEVVFRAGLVGPGASGGRNLGVWSTLADGRVLDLVARNRDAIDPTVRFGNVLRSWSNHADYAVVPATVAGRGVNASNRHVLFVDDGTDLMGLVRTGVFHPFLLAELRRMREVVQSGHDRLSIAYNLRRGVSGVTAANDSGVMAVAHTGLPIDIGPREGNGILGGQYREFFGRVAESRASDFIGYPAYRESVASHVLQQLFVDQAGGAALAYVAAEGGTAPETGGAQFRGFLGETMTADGNMIYRATLTGTGVTARNREGIWHQTEGLSFRKGYDPWPFSLPNVRFARFLGFWPARSDRVIAWVRLSGDGVTAANDGMICLRQENGSWLPLLREGDPVCGSSDGARIRTIQRVDVEPESGTYVVLASLSGNPARNQALFQGHTAAGNPTDQNLLRLARLELRKGSVFDAGLGGTSGIRSLSLSRVRDRTGAGGKGAGQVYAALERIVMTVTFDDRSREIVIGNP
ncbi:MAG: FG-GAP repeat protein [Verrucomicrobiae bacterium]|nr:FG-GAP repeat protein [Verrucomicrobiae bacterium]